MNKTLKTIAITTLAILIVGCSKDDAGTNTNSDNQPQPQQGERLLLKTYTKGASETEFLYDDHFYLIGFLEESEVQNVTYDSDKNVTQFGSTQYTYNDDGQITAMSIPDFASTSNRKASFTYNEEGLLVKSEAQETFVFVDVRCTRIFDYNSDQRLVSFVEYSDESSLYYDRYLISYDNKGNVTEIREQSSNDSGLTYTDINVYSFTYDDKNSYSQVLLAAMGVNANMNLFELPIGGGIPIGKTIHDFRPVIYSPNNLLRVSSTTGDETFAFEYEYNEEDYPVAAEENGTTAEGAAPVLNHRWTYETVEIEN
ncbi:hypothetical protein [Sinomicrobium sp.]